MLEIRPGERYNTNRQVEETLSWVKDQPCFIGTANTYEALFFLSTPAFTAATTTFSNLLTGQSAENTQGAAQRLTSPA